MPAEHQAPTEMPEKPLVHERYASPNPLAAEICLLCGGSGLFNKLRCMDCEGTGTIAVLLDDPLPPH